MKRTKEEAEQLIREANLYKDRIWKIQGKEYKLISCGLAFNSGEQDSANKNLEENYQIKGIRIEAPDGSSMHTTLEKIIDHFRKEDIELATLKKSQEEKQKEENENENEN